MADLDNDFAADDETNPFDAMTKKNENNGNLGPNYEDESDDEDDDLKKLPKYKELDDSGDELEQNEKRMQQQFKQNFNNLFANNNNLEQDDCVVQEEVSSKEIIEEQKMEPFNLKEERGEGYFDQYLNYHQTKKKESDPFYQLMDAEKEENEKKFAEKYKLNEAVIEKHKADYEKYENAQTDINLLSEWRSLLPLFEHNTQSITNAIQSLSKIINANTQSNKTRPNKKRKLNGNGCLNMYQNEKKKKKKKKRKKRAWEIESDEEEDNMKKEQEENVQINERELLGYKRKFEILSEKATLLFANGDHNIYEQTRNTLIARIKLVEDKQLFERQKKEAMEKRKKREKKNEKEKIDDMLADFDDN